MVYFYLFRCSHVTDIGVGYLSTMTSLLKLFLRWCTQIRDFGLQHMYSMRNLRVLSLAGKCRQRKVSCNITCLNTINFDLGLRDLNQRVTIILSLNKYILWLYRTASFSDVTELAFLAVIMQSGSALYPDLQSILCFTLKILAVLQEINRLWCFSSYILPVF